MANVEIHEIIIMFDEKVVIKKHLAMAPGDILKLQGQIELVDQ